MRDSFTEHLELGLLGTSAKDAVEVEVHFEADPACGDGFHEERLPAQVTLLSVKLGGLDLLPRLPAAIVAQMRKNAAQLIAEGAFA